MNIERQDLPEEPVEFIRLPEVKKLVGLGTTSIYTMPGFPKNVRLGGRAVAWIKSEVLQWNHAQIAAARGAKNQASATSASK